MHHDLPDFFFLQRLVPDLYEALGNSSGFPSVCGCLDPTGPTKKGSKGKVRYIAPETSSEFTPEEWMVGIRGRFLFFFG